MMEKVYILKKDCPNIGKETGDYYNGEYGTNEEKIKDLLARGVIEEENKNMNLIFLDTESTGTEKEDRIIQLAFKDSKSGSVLNDLFKPPLPIKIEAMAVHHITEKMVADKGPFQGSIAVGNLAQAIANDRGIVVAHNAKFDLGMLAKEGVIIEKYICTLKVARYLDDKGVIPSHSMQYLRYFLKLEVEATAHDALGDILVLEKLFERLMVKMIEKCGHNQVAALEKMIEVSGQPSLIVKFNFGKYKGNTVESVAALDRGYLEWLLKEKNKTPDEEEDWIYTLKHYLNG